MTDCLWLFYQFLTSDLVMIDEKLFSSGTCPVDALPLYLGHFQYTETCDKEVWLLYLRGPSHISKIKNETSGDSLSEW